MTLEMVCNLTTLMEHAFTPESPAAQEARSALLQAWRTTGVRFECYPSLPLLTLLEWVDGWSPMTVTPDGVECARGRFIPLYAPEVVSW